VQPCPTERFIPDRKTLAFLGFFSYATQKFIENSSPSVSMKRNKEKGKVVLVALCGGWSVYEGMALVVSVADDWRFYSGRGTDKYFRAPECVEEVPFVVPL
jgi:hypothetical protein